MADPKQSYWTIDDGESVSDSIDLLGHSVCAIDAPQMTAGSAYLVFEHSVDGGVTWKPLYFEGVRVTSVVSSSSAIDDQQNPSKWLGLRLVRCQSVQSDGSTAQAQTGAKTITPRVRDFR